MTSAFQVESLCRQISMLPVASRIVVAQNVLSSVQSEFGKVTNRDKRLQDRLEDAEDIKLVQDRLSGPFIDVDINIVYEQQF